jgi:hypothetical protein
MTTSKLEIKIKALESQIASGKLSPAIIERLESKIANLRALDKPRGFKYGFWCWGTNEKQLCVFEDWPSSSTNKFSTFTLLSIKYECEPFYGIQPEEE